MNRDEIFFQFLSTKHKMDLLENATCHSLVYYFTLKVVNDIYTINDDHLRAKKFLLLLLTLFLLTEITP